MSFAVSGTNPIVSPLSGNRDTEQSDLGFYFTARTPTPGTGIIGPTAATFVETTPILVLYNAGPFNIYPMSLRTHLTVVGVYTNMVNDYWTFTTDVGNRYTSGGTGLTIQNENANNQVSSGAFVFVGAITASAATGKRRIVGHATAKADDEADGGTEVVHDTNIFSWGDPFAASSFGTRANGAGTPCYTSISLPPIVIAPNSSLVIVKWSSSQTTGSTMEYQLSWVEK